jgi:plastocyanin
MDILDPQSMTKHVDRRYRAAGAVALALALLVPAGALGIARTASRHTVVLRDFRFHPGNLTISRGDTVTWVWGDGEQHNVTSSSFHSRTMSHGSFTVRFNHSGTFNYRCTIHEREGMRGRILVN